MGVSIQSRIPPADLLAVRREANFAYRLARILITPIALAMFRFRVLGRANVPDGPYIVISNHLGWLDPFALLYALPSEPRVHFLGDPSTLCQRPFQWWVVRKCRGYISVDREKRIDIKLARHITRCLANGGVVAIYPEGIASDDEDVLLPFHKGFAHFALKSNVPVLPLSVSGCKDLWWRKQITITIGAPIDVAGHTVETLVAEGQRRVRELRVVRRDAGRVKLFRKWLTNLM